MKRKTSEFSPHSMVTSLEWIPKAILHFLLRQVIRGRIPICLRLIGEKLAIDVEAERD